MFVLSKGNFLFFAGDNVTSFFLRRDQLTMVPAWVCALPLFKALVADGRIVATASNDKATTAAAEAPVKVNYGENKKKRAEE